MNTSYQMDDGELHIDFQLYDPEDGGSGVEINEISAGGINIAQVISAAFMALLEEHCIAHAESELRESQADAADARRDYLRDEGMAV